MTRKEYTTRVGHSFRAAEAEVPDSSYPYALFDPHEAARAAAAVWCELNGHVHVSGLCVIVVDADGHETRWQVDVTRRWDTDAREVKP